MYTWKIIAFLKILFKKEVFENVKICCQNPFYASQKHTKEYISINFFPVQCHLPQPKNSGVLLLLFFPSISYVPGMLSKNFFFNFHLGDGFLSAIISWDSHQINIARLQKHLFHSTYLFSFTLTCISVTDS